MSEVDRYIFYAINGWPDFLAPFFWFLSEATKISWVRIGLLAVVAGMVARGPKTRRAVLLSLVAFPLANEATDVLKNVFMMQRPCVELSDAIVRTAKLTSFGTASAHSANMAAVAFVMTWALGRWGWPWIVVAFLTGLSRIFNGVHYPSQVLLGWATGVFCAFVVVNTWKAYVRWRNGKETA